MCQAYSWAWDALLCIPSSALIGLQAVDYHFLKNLPVMADLKAKRCCSAASMAVQLALFRSCVSISRWLPLQAFTGASRDGLQHEMPTTADMACPMLLYLVPVIMHASHNF